MTGINDAKFKKMVVPGDVLKLHATFGKVRENMGTVEVVAKVDDKVATKAELMFVVAPDEKD